MGTEITKKSISSPYILDQDDPKIQKMRFGIASVGHGGCGAVAIYNALVALGERPDFPQVVAGCRKRLFGLLGMSRRAVMRFFSNAGYRVTLCRDRERFDACIEQYDAVILWHTWLGLPWLVGMHFFYVRRENGCTLGYNQYRARSGVNTAPYRNRQGLSKAMQGRNAVFSAAICIRKEK